MTKRKQPKPIAQMYVITIENWDNYYHFGIAESYNARSAYDSYHEIRSITLRGKLHHPDSPKLKHGMDVEIALHHEANERLKNMKSASGIGMVELHNGVLKFIITYPSDAYSGLLVALSSGMIKVAVITGTELYRRRGSVRGFELNTEFDPDEY